MKIEDKQLIKRIFEGALMAADKPLKRRDLTALFDDMESPSDKLVDEALKELVIDCEGRGYELKRVASGYRYQVRQEFSRWVNNLWQEKAPRYSRALLETLSLIAYRQPITRGEIEQIRGVAVSTQILKTLLERGWVKSVGHRDVPGRPALYATTHEFLDYFDLKTLDQLPPLAEIRDLNTISRELNIDLPIESTESANDSPEQVEDENSHDNLKTIDNLPVEDEASKKTDGNRLDEFNPDEDSIELSASNSEEISY